MISAAPLMTMDVVKRTPTTALAPMSSGLGHHAVEGLLAGFREHLRVFTYLAARDVAHDGLDVPPQVAGADGVAAHQAEDPRDAAARQLVRRRDDHRSTSL
jgi:hypothetical protein